MSKTGATTRFRTRSSSAQPLARSVDVAFVKPKHRLDTIVKLKERDEERARQDLADAQRKTAAAVEASELATARTRRDERRRGSAGEWELVEDGQVAALREARQAEQAAGNAAQHLTRKLADFVGVHRRVEALRRVVETRANEQRRDSEAREGKLLDEIAIARFGYARSSR